MSIHPTAIIDPRAELDSDVTIGPFCVVEGNVSIGARCRLYQGVYVTGWTTIGENAELHPGVIVGHTPQDIKYKGERSYCRIGRNAILRENVSIHRGTEPESETVIGDDCFLLGGSHVAHNCRLGNRVTLINNALLAGHVTVHDGVTLGGAAGVVQFVRIGELAMIAGQARVPKDIVPFALTDVEGRIAGMNRVGLRRAGFTRDDSAAIREAYRALFDSEVLFEQRLASLATLAGSAPAVQRLVDFAKAPSQRGLAGRTRRRAGVSVTDTD